MTENILDHIETTPKSTLNEKQQIAHDRIVEYVQGKAENLPQMILIRGYAGTGKTYTMKQVIQSIKSLPGYWSIAASAPTHKAVRVLRKNSDLGHGVTYATIHSLLGLKLDTDYKTGKKILVPGGDPREAKIHNFKVLIVDEVSMLGKSLFLPICEVVKEYGLKVIFLGDPVQIPPVEEERKGMPEDSLVLARPEEYGIEVVELDQIMRQKDDNPILDYATAIRQVYKTGSVVANKYNRHNGTSGIICLPATDVKTVDAILAEKFCSPEFKVDADYMKVVAYRNATVNQFNKRIRNMLYQVPEDMLALPLLVNGEKLILDDMYKLPGTNGKSLTNNEELEVVNYDVRRIALRYKTWNPLGFVEHHLNPKVYFTKVRYRGINGGYEEAEIYVVHESSTTEVANMKEEISKSAKATPYGTSERTAMWKHFYDIDGIFAKVKYNYAITAHKAQGSTYTNTMLIEWDIAKNWNVEERNRITYVGATRAKQTLYIVQ